MPLTAAQKVVFKAAFNSDLAIAASVLAKDANAIATYYNGTSTTKIWRPDIQIAELTSAIVWSEFLAGSVAQQNSYMAMIQGLVVDATKANIRAGFSTLFGNSVSATNLTAIAQRFATRLENLFQTNGVSDVYGYAVTVAEVGEALN